MGQSLGREKLEDRYFVQKVKLGSGSFGIVWRAVDKKTDVVVAMKQVNKVQMKARGIDRADIEREIEMMKRCRHKNVIELLDVFEDETNISLALEYCDGGDFGDKVKEKAQTLQESEAAEWMRQICAAVEALHSKSVCHRDIKPDNFMVAGGQLRLADFGLAVTPPDGPDGRPAAGLITQKCGTPAFMAPEQHRLPSMSPGYSYPVDMWAAGLTMYMLICGGKHPFINSNGDFDERRYYAGELEFNSEGPFRFTSRQPQISDSAKELCRRMVQPDVQRRITAQATMWDPWLLPAGRGMPFDNFLQKPAGAVAPAAAKQSGTTSAADATEVAAAALLAGGFIVATMASDSLGTSDFGKAQAAQARGAQEQRSQPGAGVNQASLGSTGGGVNQAGYGHLPGSGVNEATFQQPGRPMPGGAPSAEAQRIQTLEKQLAEARQEVQVVKNRPKETLDKKVLTVVMVGPTGQGKSTLGNMLVGGSSGFNPFKTSDDFDSETLESSHADFTHDSKPHRVIDTIGFLDTRMDAAENMDKFATFADRTPAGIDAFLFVLKKGRFTEQSLGQLVAFKSVAGADALQHTILLFTHCGAETTEALRERCRGSANQHLLSAVDSCADVLGVDSIEEERCHEDRENLLQVIGEVVRKNKGVKYDNATLTEARERRQELIEKISRLSTERRDAMEDKLNGLFNGRLTFERVQADVDDAIQREERDRQAEAERQSLQALLGAAKSEAAAWKQIAQNALRGAAGNQGDSMGLAGCCGPMPAGIQAA